MKIWAKIIKHHKIINEAVQEFDSARPSDVEGWRPIVVALCKPLDLECPVILKKHITELQRFSRTVFSQGDFIDGVSFDHFELEIFPEKKKESRVEYIFGDE